MATAALWSRPTASVSIRADDRAVQAAEMDEPAVQACARKATSETVTNKDGRG